MATYMTTFSASGSGNLRVNIPVIANSEKEALAKGREEAERWAKEAGVKVLSGAVGKAPAF